MRQQRDYSLFTPLRASAVKVVLFFILIMSLGLGYVPISAQNILIYSTSHGGDHPRLVKKKKGVLRVEVSTFTPIEEIQVNDTLRKPQKKTSAVIDIPFDLKQGRNRFTISVKTKAGFETKDFFLDYYGPGEKPDSDTGNVLHINALVGLQYTDNADDEPKEVKGKKGVKLFIIVNPIYIEKIDATSSFIYRLVLLRDKYFADDEVVAELGFTQISAGWHNKVGFGSWELSLGNNNIGTKPNGVFGLLNTEHQLESDLFVAGTARITALSGNVIDFELKSTKRSMAFTESDTRDGNGNLYSLYLALKHSFRGWDGKLNALSESNDALGKYQDYTASAVGIGVGYPLSARWSLDTLLSSTRTTYKEKDPLYKDEREINTLNSLSVKGIYTFPEKKGQFFYTEFRVRNQTSSIEAKRFQTLSVAAAMIVSF